MEMVFPVHVQRKEKERMKLRQYSLTGKNTQALA